MRGSGGRSSQGRRVRAALGIRAKGSLEMKGVYGSSIFVRCGRGVS